MVFQSGTEDEGSMCLNLVCFSPFSISFSFRSLIALYSVPCEILQTSQISETLIAFASWSFKAFSIVFLSIGGLPPLRPLALAAVKPSFVRCTVKSRSNWQRAERTVTSSLPVGVLISIFSFRLTNVTPRSLNNSTKDNRSLWNVLTLKAFYNTGRPQHFVY